MNMSAMGFARTCTPARVAVHVVGPDSRTPTSSRTSARFDEPTLVVLRGPRPRGLLRSRRPARSSTRAPRPTSGSCASRARGTTSSPSLGEKVAAGRRPADGRARALDKRAVRVSGARVVVVYHSERGRTRALAEAAVVGPRRSPASMASAAGARARRASPRTSWRAPTRSSSERRPTWAAPRPRSRRSWTRPRPSGRCRAGATSSPRGSRTRPRPAATSSAR